MHGQSCPGGGVDCVRFVVAVLDELYRVGDDAEAVPVIPPDASWHDPAGAMHVARVISRRYPNEEVVGDTVTVAPGDVLVMQVSSVAGSPGHIAIVGPRPNTIWHANPGMGVAEAGLGEVKRLLHAWRMKDKASWLR